MVTSACSGVIFAALRASVTASKSLGSVRISQLSPSSERSSAPASRTISVSLSSDAADLATVMTPFLVNIQETEFGLAEVSAVLRECVTDLADGAVFVVGEDVDDEGDAAGAVALVSDLFVADAFELAGSALDGAFDVVGGHVLSFGGGDGAAQAGVAVGIAAAGFGGDGDFLDEAGKDFAAFGVCGALFMLDCRPF